MIAKVIRYSKHVQLMQRVNVALARAAVTSSLRQINPTNPISWEFCGFSQNGEDGIIDFLTRQVKKPNRYFIEIGSSYGIENNTSWLAVGRKFGGLMIDANSEASYWSNNIISSLNLLVKSICMCVHVKKIVELRELALYLNPDVFSIDIDGNDYYIAKAVLESGFRPKIFVVEYNSAFGPSKSLTVEYRDDFSVDKAHKSGLYYGVSIAGWKNFFESFDYKFVTVESNGVNAFFLDSAEFDHEFVCPLRGLDYQENLRQLCKFGVRWEKQFGMIQDMQFVEIKYRSYRHVQR